MEPLFVAQELYVDMLSHGPEVVVAILKDGVPFQSGARDGVLFPSFDASNFEKVGDVKLVIEKSQDLEGVNELIGYTLKEPVTTPDPRLKDSPYTAPDPLWGPVATLNDIRDLLVQILQELKLG